MKFFDIINQWANRYFSQPDAIYLVAALIGAMLVLMVFGAALAPAAPGSANLFAASCAFAVAAAVSLQPLRGFEVANALARVLEAAERT